MNANKKTGTKASKAQNLTLSSKYDTTRLPISTLSKNLKCSQLRCIICIPYL